MHAQTLRPWPLVLVVWGILGVSIGRVAPAKDSPLTDRSPEVRKAVKQAVAFLESNAAVDNRVGAQALAGLALWNYSAYDEAELSVDPRVAHPRIVAAAASIQNALGNRDPQKLNLDIYSTGLAIIFLVDLDSRKYHDDIECLLKYLQQRQKSHGGWGYPELLTGDTSMTQYAVLSSWEAAEAGFNVPLKSIEAVATWLMRTQDPNGGFGYQGIPGELDKLVPQTGVRPSMSAAGAASLYICGQLLGLTGQVEKRKSKLPSSLRPSKDQKPKEATGRPKSKMDPRPLREAQARANQWFADNYKIEVAEYNFYYLYALERYKSVFERSENKTDASPQWYTDGARLLIARQAASGSWSDNGGPVPDTAFGALFLMRAMKKKLAIADPERLPRMTATVERGIGQLMDKEHAKHEGPESKIWESLDDPDDIHFDEALKQLVDLPPEEIEALGPKRLEAIRRLARHKSADVRWRVVQTLAKPRNLDNAPVLIYALTDPDPQIAQEANEGLLRISRKPASDFPLSANATEADRHALAEKWRTWYRTIRPNDDAPVK